MGRFLGSGGGWDGKWIGDNSFLVSVFGSSTDKNFQLQIGVQGNE